MRKIVLVLTVICSMSAASAEEGQSYLSAGFIEFAAPVVYSRQNLTEAVAGAIVYDSVSGAFYGLLPGGNPSSTTGWIQLGATASGGNPITSTNNGQERVERVVISSTTPTITSQSGTWVSSLTKNAVGDLTVNIVTGQFSAAPTCVCNVLTSTTYACMVDSSATATSVRVKLLNTNTGAAADGGANIICMGPK